MLLFIHYTHHLKQFVCFIAVFVQTRSQKIYFISTNEWFPIVHLNTVSLTDDLIKILKVNHPLTALEITCNVFCKSRNCATHLHLVTRCSINEWVRHQNANLKQEMLNENLINTTRFNGLNLISISISPAGKSVSLTRVDIKISFPVLHHTQRSCLICFQMDPFGFLLRRCSGTHLARLWRLS